MSHVDDGRLNALLDGELDAAEADAVRAHIAECAECTRRLEEAKQFLAGAADLLGALDLPATLSVPAPPSVAPVRRVSRTAKEVAIDIDGATHKSPAIRPNLPEPAPPPPAARRYFDFTTLSWAAMVVLALGVGYLANEVRHTRGGPATGEGTVVGGNAIVPVASPGPGAVLTPRAGASQVALKGGAAGRASAATPAQAMPRSPGAAGVTKSAPPPLGKRLAARTDAAAAHRQPARPSVLDELAAAPAAGARAQEAAGARPAPAPAAGVPATDFPVGNAAALAVTGVAAPRDAAASFQRVTLEDAVTRLDGVIRLMDGMRFERVEVGPGRLVPGADRGRELVRLVYFDAAGRRLVLDQQRVAPTVSGGAVRADIGMTPGDTLITAAPGGEMRVRWLDGPFWLSLTGNLPADELRRLIERVR